jgi:hypothetical protein
MLVTQKYITEIDVFKYYPPTRAVDEAMMKFDYPLNIKKFHLQTKPGKFST